MPCSSNAFAMIVVLETATMAPANTLSSVVQSSSRPATKPSQIITLHWISAVTPAVGAARNSFATLNSRPSPNIRRITPSSDNVSTISASATSGIGTCGPMIRPARM
jgi:hypothetical protein